MIGPELILSVVATTLAVASFGAGAWRIWRDRPRLIFFVRPITFTNVPHFGEMKMAQIMICNVGYRPLILTRFMALGKTSTFQMGIDDEPAAALGKEDQKFPCLIQPGETLRIHPIGIEALRRNITDPQDPKVHFDPYRYFAIVDSFDRFHLMEAQNVLFDLRLTKHQRRTRGWRKLMQRLAQRRFVRSLRRQPHLLS
jgi:hypothetical protein